ncbi:uncharacterized protein VTP21DRAFT_10779 [Calcarisporiella thermophila]|uniref:uncharacterized protein n=1 Tax=Calcarisporiella thermophila TaxID=911321 RepID=UPI0037427872
MAANDEAKYLRKYKELKKRVREMEEDNERLTVKLARAKKLIQRIKLERSFLFDRLEQAAPPDPDAGAVSDSSLFSSDSDHDISFNQEPGMTTPTSGRGRWKRDPKAPKRPANAFFMYCQLQRQHLRDQHQDMPLSDFTKMLGQQWKALPPEEKNKYYEMYSKDKERYQKEMSTYTENKHTSGGTGTAGGGRPRGRPSTGATTDDQNLRSDPILPEEEEDLEGVIAEMGGPEALAGIVGEEEDWGPVPEDLGLEEEE